MKGSDPNDRPKVARGSQKPETRNLKPEPSSTREVVTYVPVRGEVMSNEEALGCLAGKGNLPDQRAVLAVIQWSREDAVRDMVRPSMGEREAGWMAGRAFALQELEEILRNAYGKGV